jgi:hypothetical protein
MPQTRGRQRPSGRKILSASAAFLCLGILPLLITFSPLVFTLLSIIAAGFAMAGGWTIEANPTNGIALLWTACGVALALGLIGIFSFGLIYIFAGILILMAISAAPNPNGHSWFGIKFILPEIVSFAATLALVLR